MKSRSFLFQIPAFLLLLGTGGVTFGVLSAENNRREEKKNQVFLLEKIRQSKREAAFEGECTIDTHFQENQYTTRIKIVRRGEERRVHLIDTKGGKKIRHGSKRRFSGGIAGFFQPGKFRRGRFHDPARIVDNYHMTVQEGNECGGRRGRLIRLEPKSKDRPSYELVADDQTSFPLRFSVLGREGETAFEKRFDSIRFFPEIYRGKMRSRHHERASWLKISREEIAFDQDNGFHFPIWAPGHLPEGFVRTDAMRVRIETSNPTNKLPQFRMNIEMVHLIYSDGIALFSVVQFSNENPAWKMMKSFFPETGSGDGISTRKLSLGIGSAFILELEGTVIILAGNIWEESLQKTAESLKPHIGEQP